MPGLPRTTRMIVLVITLPMTLSACGWSALVDRPEVRQGTMLTAADVRRIEIGMPRARVRELLGTPLLHDSFHPERWDYVYYRIEGGMRVDDPERLTLVFEDDRVIRIMDHYASPESRAGTAAVDESS